jgi:hypothetical protein
VRCKNCPNEYFCTLVQGAAHEPCFCN